MKTGKKMLAVMLTAIFMMVAGAGIAHAASDAELQAIIKADVDAGLSLDGAIKKALKTGASIEKVIDAALKAGVPMKHVMYVAIKQGHDRGMIEKAALNTGASVDILKGVFISINLDTGKLKSEIAASEAAKFAAAVKKDLQSGMSLSEVMAKAKENGKTTEQIMDGAIKAGAKPADVVYVAIAVLNLSAEQVVKAAIQTGAALTAVIPAAISAGAPDEKVASIIAQTNTGLLGYTAPTTAANTSWSTQLSSNYSYKITVISGGGGGTASTKTASPI